MTYNLPKNSAYEEVLGEMKEHLEMFEWVTLGGEEKVDGSVAYKKIEKRTIGDRIGYTIELHVISDEYVSHTQFSVKSFINIENVRREDIENMEDVMDKELSSAIHDSKANGMGVGPKVLRNLIVADENKHLSQAYKVLGYYARKNEENF